MRDVRSITVIGAGHMGGSIIRGLVEAERFSPENITVVDPHEDRLAEFAELGTRTATRASDLEPTVAYLLAVKPAHVRMVLADYDGLLQGKLLISIVAGMSTTTLEELTYGNGPVVRVMPNIAASVRESMSVVARGKSASAQDSAAVVDIFSALGEAIEIPEDQLDVAGAISGCGPAYTALIVDALTRAGVANGLPAEVGRALALQTLSGTTELMKRTGVNPRILMEQVSSPAGTTIAALDAMEQQVLDAFRFGVDAAIERSGELSREA